MYNSEGYLNEDDVRGKRRGAEAAGAREGTAPIMCKVRDFRARLNSAPFSPFLPAAPFPLAHAFAIFRAAVIHTAGIA